MKSEKIKLYKKIISKGKYVIVLTCSTLFLTISNQETIDVNASVIIEEQTLKDEMIIKENYLKEKDEKNEVDMVVVGDNLISSSVYKSGIRGGIYNYDHLYSKIKYMLNNSDINVINQETMLVKDESNYSGYPCFGSPYEIGEAVIDASFNVVLHATNHTYDKGLKGINDTIEFWKKYKDITVLGLHENVEDANEIEVIEKNGIKIAMLNYTYGLNGFVLPDGMDYLVDTLYDKEKVLEDIKRAEKLGDITIVFVHWGAEYVTTPGEYQIDYAEDMAEAGVDLIVGGHPHVVQPLEYISTTDKRIVPVYYSLGNFVSSQDEKIRALGGMALINIKKVNNYVSLNCELIPIVTQMEKEEGKRDFTVYSLTDYTDALANRHMLGVSVDYLYETWNSIVDGPQKVYRKK